MLVVEGKCMHTLQVPKGCPPAKPSTCFSIVWGRQAQATLAQLAQPQAGCAAGLVSHLLHNRRWQ